MKNLSNLVVFLWLTTLTLANAQTFTCPTGVDSPNNSYGTVNNYPRPNFECKMSVNVFIHLVARSNGIGAPAVSAVGQVMSRLNSVFNPYSIFFENTGYDQINGDQFGNPRVVTLANYTNLLGVNAQSNAIDIYLLPAGATTFGGIASGAPGKAFILDGSLLYVNNAVGNVVCHEMGHCLNLFHTFHGTAEGGSCPELVDGSNSDTCGDFITDTRADPVGDVGFCQSNCNFSFNSNQCNGQDRNGQNYNPDLRNIMSYGSPPCLTSFTNNQAGRMMAALQSASVLDPVKVFTPNFIARYTSGGTTYYTRLGTNGVTLSGGVTQSNIIFTNQQSGLKYFWNINSRSSPGADFYPAGTNGGTNGDAYVVCNPGKSISITYTVKAPCGDFVYTFNYYNVSGSGFRLVSFPNPANDMLNVVAQKDEGGQTSNLSEDNTSNLADVNADLKLSSKEGTTLWHGKMGKGKASFSTAHIPNGVYYLRFVDPVKKTNIDTQISIQH